MFKPQQLLVEVKWNENNLSSYNTNSKNIQSSTRTDMLLMNPVRYDESVALQVTRIFWPLHFSTSSTWNSFAVKPPSLLLNSCRGTEQNSLFGLMGDQSQYGLHERWILPLIFRMGHINSHGSFSLILILYSTPAFLIVYSSISLPNILD